MKRLRGPAEAQAGFIADAVHAVARGLAAALLAWTVAASAADAAATASMRDRVRAERAQAEAQHAERERACRARFAVSACLEAASATRRETLARLRRQEVEIDETERRERAAARRARIEAKTGAAMPRGDPPSKLPSEPSLGPLRRGASGTAENGASSPPPAGDPALPGASATPPRAPRPAPSPPAPIPPRAPRPVVDHTAREAAERAAFERRQRQAAAHRETVERRNADAAKRGPPAAPLPLPQPAASAR